MKDSKGNVSYTAIMMIFGLPLMTFIGVCFILTRKGDDVAESDVKKVNEEKQKKKK